MTIRRSTYNRSYVNGNSLPERLLATTIRVSPQTLFVNHPICYKIAVYYTRTT